MLGKPGGLGYISAYAILPLRHFAYVDSRPDSLSESGTLYLWRFPLPRRRRANI